MRKRCAICFLLIWIFIHILHTYPLLQSQYAAIALTKPCISFTQILLTKRVIFSQALTLAPWRWFLCKPKHVGSFLSNLECFNNSAFLTLCASVGNKKGSVHPYYLIVTLHRIHYNTNMLLYLITFGYICLNIKARVYSRNFPGMLFLKEKTA